MTYEIQAGLQLSLDGNTWYALTDHNRKPISITPTIIEKSARMADGTMRKYVIASKDTISTSWSMLPSRSYNPDGSLGYTTVDHGYSSAWLAAFYKANVFVPIYLKVVHSKDTTPSTKGSLPDDSTFQSARTTYDIYKVFITKFDVQTTHRNHNIDFVEMNIEFTEI